MEEGAEIIWRYFRKGEKKRRITDETEIYRNLEGGREGGRETEEEEEESSPANRKKFTFWEREWKQFVYQLLCNLKEVNMSIRPRDTYPGIGRNYWLWLYPTTPNAFKRRWQENRHLAVGVEFATNDSRKWYRAIVNAHWGGWCPLSGAGSEWCCHWKGLRILVMALLLLVGKYLI